MKSGYILHAGGGFFEEYLWNSSVSSSKVQASKEIGRVTVVMWKLRGRAAVGQRRL